VRTSRSAASARPNRRSSSSARARASLRRRVLIEVTPIVGELSQEIYGSPAEAFAGFAAAFNDREFEVLHRFQQLSQTWLEERLARVEQLTADKGSEGGPSG
jgi:hypothetical protein